MYRNTSEQPAPLPRAPPPAAGLMAIIRCPSARVLSVLYQNDVEYCLVPQFLIDQMLNIPQPAPRYEDNDRQY